jgi:hypothetical protein
MLSALLHVCLAGFTFFSSLLVHAFSFLFPSHRLLKIFNINCTVYFSRQLLLLNYLLYNKKYMKQVFFTVLSSLRFESHFSRDAAERKGRKGKIQPCRLWMIVCHKSHSDKKLLAVCHMWLKVTRSVSQVTRSGSQ